MNKHPDASNLTNRGGRPKGAKNKITKDIKETWEHVFAKFQDDKKASLEAWGRANLTAFYTVSSKFIPIKNDTTITQRDGYSPIERAARVIALLELAAAERDRQALERQAVGALAGPTDGGLLQ